MAHLLLCLSFVQCLDRALNQTLRPEMLPDNVRVLEPTFPRSVGQDTSQQAAPQRVPDPAVNRKAWLLHPKREELTSPS